MTAQYDPTEVSRVLSNGPFHNEEDSIIAHEQLEAASALLERCKRHLAHDSACAAVAILPRAFKCDCGLADLLNQIEGKK